MVRTQIQFDERQYQRIRSLAHRRRVSVAETVRRLVDRGLRHEDEPAGPEFNALLAAAGVGASGLSDLGRRHDHYLELDATPTRKTASRRRKAP